MSRPPGGQRPPGHNGKKATPRFVKKGNARYDRHDPFYRRAKQEGFAARSIYKLEEIDEALGLVRPTDRVLDLGSAPGSWLQYVERRLAPGRGGRAVGIDLLPVPTSYAAHIVVLQGDAFNLDDATLAAALQCDPPRLDLILSDMAPNTTGIRSVDQDRSHALCEHALEIAARLVVPGGRFCCKIFEGGDTRAFLERARALFHEVKIRRPKSTREGSMETYIIGLNRRAGAPPPHPADVPNDAPNDA